MAGERMNQFLLLARMTGRSLVRRRARLVGAVSALAVGSALLAGLLAVSIELPRQMGQEFRAYGANLLIGPGSDLPTLSDDDLGRTVAQLPTAQVVGVAPELYETVTVNRSTLSVVGVDFDQTKKVAPYWQVAGSWPTGPSGVLVGAEIAENLGLAVGQTITLTKPHERTGRRVTIEGILRTGESEETFLYADRRLLEELFGLPPSLHLARVSIVSSQAGLESMASRLSEGDSKVSVRVVKQLSRSEDHVLGLLTTLLLMVTSVIVVLTFICVLTTMTATILERRAEIGLKKALGARNRTIVAEFLGESLVLGLLGGVFGALLGFGLAWLIGWNVFGRSLVAGPETLGIALGLSVVVALVASLWPVRSATRLEPALVLRGE